MRLTRWALFAVSRGMMRRRSLTAVLVYLLSVAVGCGAAEPMAAKADYATGAAAPSAAPMAESAPGGGDYGGLAAAFRRPDTDGIASNGPSPQASASSTAQGPNDTVQVHGPMLVYTATLHLSVIQVADVSKQVEAMARETGGFLARRDDTEIVIRVPVAKFEDTMKRLEKLGEVLHRNVVAEDVSEQFLDAETRLKSARAVRDRLQQLLEKSTKVQDSLAIEKELARIGTEIEALESKLKYLRDRAQFSTITVRLSARQADGVKAQAVRIPVEWLDHLGLGRLLEL